MEDVVFMFMFFLRGCVLADCVFVVDAHVDWFRVGGVPVTAFTLNNTIVDGIHVDGSH